MAFEKTGRKGLGDNAQPTPAARPMPEPVPPGEEWVADPKIGPGGKTPVPKPTVPSPPAPDDSSK